MKILQINTVYNSGSIGHIVADIKQYVEKKKINVLSHMGEENLKIQIRIKYLEK